MSRAARSTGRRSARARARLGAAGRCRRRSCARSTPSSGAPGWRSTTSPARPTDGWRRASSRTVDLARAAGGLGAGMATDRGPPAGVELAPATPRPDAADLGRPAPAGAGARQPDRQRDRARWGAGGRARVQARRRRADRDHRRRAGPSGTAGRDHAARASGSRGTWTRPCDRGGDRVGTRWPPRGPAGGGRAAPAWCSTCPAAAAERPRARGQPRRGCPAPSRPATPAARAARHTGRTEAACPLQAGSQQAEVHAIVQRRRMS